MTLFCGSPSPGIRSCPKRYTKPQRSAHCAHQNTTLRRLDTLKHNDSHNVRSRDPLIVALCHRERDLVRKGTLNHNVSHIMHTIRRLDTLKHNDCHNLGGRDPLLLALNHRECDLVRKGVPFCALCTLGRNVLRVMYTRTYCWVR